MKGATKLALKTGVGAPSWATGTDLAWDFTTPGGKYFGAVDPTDTHAASIYMPDKTGLWVPKAANVLCREDGVGLQTVPSRTNSNPVSNSGGTVGVVGSGGALPSGWSVGSMTSTTINSIVDNPDGTRTWDITFVCDNSGGGATIFPRLSFTSSAVIAAASGQTWTASCTVELVSRTSNNTIPSRDQVSSSVVENDTAGVYIGETLSSTLINPGDKGRLTSTRTFGASAGYAKHQLSLPGGTEAGKTTTVRVKITAPDLEQGSFATPFKPTTGSAATVNGNQQVIDLTGRLTQGVAGVLQVDLKAIEALKMMLMFSDGTNSNRVRIQHNGATLNLYSLTGGNDTATPASAGGATGVRTFAFAASSSFLAIREVDQGQCGGTVAITHPPGMTRLGLGGRGWAADANTYQMTKKLALKFGPQDQSSFDVMFVRAQLAAVA